MNHHLGCALGALIILTSVPVVVHAAPAPTPRQLQREIDALTTDVNTLKSQLAAMHGAAVTLSLSGPSAAPDPWSPATFDNHVVSSCPDGEVQVATQMGAFNGGNPTTGRALCATISAKIP